jgi:outer membrane receptor protein involved in Fe transport
MPRVRTGQPFARTDLPAGHIPRPCWGWRPFAPAALLLVSLGAPAQAQEGRADLAAEADLQFEIAIDRYKAGDYRGALEHLLASNRLAPNRNVVFNIARTYEGLGRFPEAWRHYAEFAAAEPDAERRAAAEAAMARIAPRVALLDVRSDPPGATVYLDRRDLGARGTTPLSIAVEPGAHKVLLEAEGHVPTDVAVQADTGERRAVSGQLPARLGTIQLDGGPAGASVSRVLPDGSTVALGTLPGAVSAPPGSQVLRFEAPDHVTQELRFDVVADEAGALRVNLARRTGKLVVDAVEAGALVEVDGIARGFTPAVLDVPLGDHEVTISLPGFEPYASPVKVGEAATARVSATMRSLQEVTAASRTTEAAEAAPASVSIVPRQEIRAFGYQSVYEALAATRGVFQTDDLTYRSLGIRGFARPGDYGNRVLVTHDGHTLNDDQLGGSYTAEDLSVDLGDVERIEVVRGAGSALYGTNAFLGVINVVNRGNDAVPRPHVSVTASEDRALRVRAGGGIGDANAGFWASAAGLTAQGADFDFQEYADEPGGGRVVGADGTRAYTFQAKAWVKDLTIQGYVNGRNKRVPTGAFDTLLGDDRTAVRDLRGYGEIRYTPKLGQIGQLFARAYIDGYRYRGTFPYDDGAVDDAWDGAWIGVEPRVVLDPTPWLRATVGAEVRAAVLGDLRSSEGDASVLDVDARQNVFSGYAVLSAKAGKWLSAELGGRYDHFTLGGFGGAFNPRGAIVLKPSGDDTIKLLGGTAFRAPSPYELFYNDGGITQVQATGLGPERIATGELEYTHRFGDVVSVVADGWFNQLSQLIDTAGVGASDTFAYTNVAAPTRAMGGEFEIRRDWRKGWMFAAQYSLQSSATPGPIDGTALTNSPNHLLSVKGAAPISSTGATVSSRAMVGAPRLTQSGERTDWAVVWDVTLTGDLPLVPLGYSLGVRNLLDWRSSHPGGLDLRQTSLPQPGRTFFAQLSLSL